MKLTLKLINEFFREEKDKITEKNWQLVKELSLVYFVCLTVYFIFVCLPESTVAHVTAIKVALCIHALLCVILLSFRKVPGYNTVSIILLLFGAEIAALTIYLGTFVFQNNSALLFPLMIIMLTQFYTLHPFRTLTLLLVSSLTFLILSYCLKATDIFYLDVLSTLVALSISLIAVYTTIKYKVEMYLKQKELNWYCTHDVLSKALNKAAFSYEFEERYVKESNDSKIAIAIVDIDKFKAINDCYGHIAGDEIICEISKTLINKFKKDNVCRFGGDEFVIMVENALSVEQLNNLFAEYIEELKCAKNEKNISVTCSIGVAFSDNKAIDLKKLITLADKTMYEIKQAGGNNFKVNSL